MSILRSRASRAWRNGVITLLGLGTLAVPLVVTSPAASAAQASGDPIVLGNVGT
jgi:hypothetical protein